MSERPFYIAEDEPPAKRAIRLAAMKLFSERGMAATSIRDIAAESGYTNPALYKHFSGKEELAQDLFEVCHRYVWSTCADAMAGESAFAGKLDAFIGRWLELMDDHPEVIAFLSDSARVLWPRAGRIVRRKTMIGLARSLFEQAPVKGGKTRSAMEIDLLAASLEGTLAELGRMIEVGAAKGPAKRWKDDLVAFFRKAVR